MFKYASMLKLLLLIAGIEFSHMLSHTVDYSSSDNSFNHDTSSPVVFSKMIWGLGDDLTPPLNSIESSGGNFSGRFSDVDTEVGIVCLHSVSTTCFHFLFKQNFYT